MVSTNSSGLPPRMLPASVGGLKLEGDGSMGEPIAILLPVFFFRDGRLVELGPRMKDTVGSSLKLVGRPIPIGVTLYSKLFQVDSVVLLFASIELYSVSMIIVPFIGKIWNARIVFPVARRLDSIVAPVRR
jgi:hypothetical protein